MGLGHGSAGRALAWHERPWVYLRHPRTPALRGWEAKVTLSYTRHHLKKRNIMYTLIKAKWDCNRLRGYAGWLHVN